MATLPGVADLGATPTAAPARPIGTYDVSGYARGAQEIAQGGKALGAGIAKAGEGVGDLAIDQSRWEYARAHSEFLTGKVDLDASTVKDTNPGPDPTTGKSLPNRYAEQLWQQRDAAAAKISDPRMRERFLSEIGPTVEHGIVAANNHATGLQNNADIAYTQTQGNTIINKAIGASDDETRRQLIDSHNQLVDGLLAKGAVTPERALAMKQEWAHQYATADLLARSDQDPQGVINELRAKPGSPDQLINRIVQTESGGDPHSRSKTSSAYGAAQFLESRPGGDTTWADLLKAHHPELVAGRSLEEINALRADPNLSRELLGHLIETNRGILQKAGVEPTPGALYLSHFLGPAGAIAVSKADPNQPVADVLAKAVGPDMAAKMVQANQSVLGGKLAGSVTQWANGKMGGQVPGGGSIYDILRPDVREQILTHAQGQLQKQTVNDLTGFRSRLEDSQAEAARTGNLVNPIPQSEFIAHLGAADGPKAYETYKTNIQLGFDVASVAQMSPAEQQKLLAGYEPQPGAAGFAETEKRRDILVKAIDHANTERQKDPAGFAISRLPASGETWKGFAGVVGDPSVSEEDKQAAARKFAAVTLAEQERVGIASELRAILPKSYIDSFNKQITTAGDSDDPQKRVGLVGIVKQEAATWGDQWSAVMRQLAPAAQPIVRAIAAGADETAMTRLLSLGKDENPAKILKEQSEQKFGDLTKALNTEMAPFLSTLVGRQKDRDFPGYYGLAEKLTALEMRDGKSADVAAHDAFNALVGNRYDFRDTYRIPKSSGFPPGAVQAGAQAARSQLGAGVQINANFDQAKADLGLTPQEQDLYQRHLRNLTGPGGVDNPDGSRSTLYQASFERDGKTYNVPTVWDGKILKPADAIKRAEREGLDKFPSYASEDEAEARYGKMHGYMEKDTAQFLQRRSDPLADVKPAIDDIGLSDNRTDSLTKFGRDGVWVTAPDNSGLNLVYGDKFVRRQSDGKPLLLPWSDLAARGQRDFEAIAAAPLPSDR